MIDETIDTLLSKAKNKFLLANAVAGRAKQISEGSLPYIDNFDPTNSIITAMREIAGEKIKIKMVTAESKKPQLVEVLAEEEPTALEKLAKEKKKKSSKKK